MMDDQNSQKISLDFTYATDCWKWWSVMFYSPIYDFMAIFMQLAYNGFVNNENLDLCQKACRDK